jgi:hypothetical protein
MNSDFMQQQGERLARRVAPEPDNTARIQKAYRLIFGRSAADSELKAGLAFLATEPLKQYEERKAAPKKDDKKKDDDAGERDEDGKSTKPDGADGMMAGVIPGAAKKDDDKKLLPATPLGRYMKILLSSNEFLYVD